MRRASRQEESRRWVIPYLLSALRGKSPKPAFFFEAPASGVCVWGLMQSSRACSLSHARARTARVRRGGQPRCGTARVPASPTAALARARPKYGRLRPSLTDMGPNGGVRTNSGGNSPNSIRSLWSKAAFTLPKSVQSTLPRTLLTLADPGRVRPLSAAIRPNSARIRKRMAQRSPS